MYPIMEAADIVIRDGNLDVARSLMKRLVNVPDTAFREYLEGMLASRSGDRDGAVRHLIRSNAIDQSFIRTYDILISMDPGKGWDVLRNIPLMIAGERPKKVSTDDNDMLELQEIYDGWYSGDKGAARKRLKTSGGFTSGHFDFLLAAARIAGDVGEYDRSLDLYDRILSKYAKIDSIIVEKANILTAMGRRNDAISVFETMDEDNRNNRNMTECMLRALASKNTEKEFSSHSDDFLRSEHGDKKGHLLVCELMSKIGMNSEAGKILSMLMPMFPDDLGIHLANARNEIRLGRDTSALKAADKIVKLSPRTADGYCIRSEIHLRYGRVKAAVKEGERALRCDPDHIDSLAVMKSVRIRSKEYDKALEICRRILILDPDNADAAKDMAYALDMLGKRQEAVEEYRNALRLRKDAGMIISILSALIEGDRAEDAADIAGEFVDDSDNADIWCLKGNAEYQSSNFAGASRSYAKALETRPHDARLWHSKGLAEEMAGMYKEAESSYDRAVIIDLDNPEFWLSKAIVQEKRGDLKGAVLSLNRVISDSPDNVFALVRKSRILAYAGRPKEAMFFLDHALKVDSKNIKILEIKKNIYKRGGMHDDVIDTCKSILKADRTNIGALTDMAESYQKLGKHDDALKVLSSVSSDIGEAGVLMMKKNSARLNGNTDVEIDACRSILKAEPNNRSVRLDLADALIRSGDHRGAMDIYDDIQSKDPKDAEVTVLRGRLRSAMGDDTNAVALYHEAVLKDPDNSDTLNELANALCDSGEYREALNMASRAIEISPDVPKVHLTKVRVLLAMKDTGSALAALKDALEEVSESGEIYMRIGGIYEERRVLDDALTAYGSAIRSGLDNSDAHYKRGRVQEMLGNREAAKKSYSASGAKDRDNVRAWERLGTLQLDDNEYNASKKSLDSALAADPFDAPSLLSRARLYAKEGNKEKAIPIYRTLSNREDRHEDIEKELNDLLMNTKGPEDTEDVPAAAAGDDNEYENIGRTYDLALLALERAYATGKAISDARMLSDLGIKGKEKGAVLDYLSGIEEYGDINTGSKEFERMERLSKNVILSEKIDDIDSNPLVSIPAAFVASAAETIDDAKKLIAYIYKAVSDGSDPVAFSDDVSEAVAEISEMSGDITTYNIMRQFNVGIHTARTIGKLSKMDRKGTDMHI
jgi:tetratricopeptide (TPR) repeat protein